MMFFPRLLAQLTPPQPSIQLKYHLFRERLSPAILSCSQHSVIQLHLHALFMAFIFSPKEWKFRGAGILSVLSTLYLTVSVTEQVLNKYFLNE